MSAAEPKHSSLTIKLGEVSVSFEGDHSFVASESGLIKILEKVVELSGALPKSSVSPSGERASGRAESSSQHKPSFKSFLATRGEGTIVDLFIGAAFYLRRYEGKEKFSQNELRQAMRKGGDLYLKSRITVEKNTRTYINRLIMQKKFLEHSDGNFSLAEDLHESIRSTLKE